MPICSFQNKPIISYSILAAIASATILGFAKSGFKGLGFVIVSLMAVAYESKASTGILLQLLIFADCLAIIYYRNDVEWKTMFQLFVPMAVGIVVGVFVGDKLSLELFRQFMAGIILVSGVLLLVISRMDKQKIPKGKGFAIVMGLGAGFCTMVGNLAGAFTNIYFLAMQFPKRAFIGTVAWLFFFSNLFKLPFHIWVWETVSWHTLTEILYLIPFVLLGFGIGIKLIEKVSNQLFQQYIITITLLGAILILIGA